MKKVYSTPDMSIFGVETTNSLFAGTPTGDLTTTPREGYSNSGGLAKERNDEEYYDSEGDAYGNLW